MQLLILHLDRVLSSNLAWISQSVTSVLHWLEGTCHLIISEQVSTHWSPASLHYSTQAHRPWTKQLKPHNRPIPTTQQTCTTTMTSTRQRKNKPKIAGAIPKKHPRAFSASFATPPRHCRASTARTPLLPPETPSLQFLTAATHVQLPIGRTMKHTV